MATFRTGFKIFGEITLRQSLGRIRSFSEDRKPGQWSPEDQWAVRPPCTTCPDPNAPKIPPKPSKSWLSICRDAKEPDDCDYRHNNCPPPQKKEDEPWYAFITKKRVEKPKPPIECCRLEMMRQSQEPQEEVCEEMQDHTWPGNYEKIQSEPVCTEKKPAPVVRLACPPPKDLDLMLWCGRPGASVCRIPAQCQTDRLPYDEFRPQKCWKSPPFSLPCKGQTTPNQPFCSNVGRAPLAEFKQVDIPKPLYTRYKSVELEDENFLMCMTDAKCPTDDQPCLAIQPPPLTKNLKMEMEEEEDCSKPEPCIEKPVLVAGSQKPVKLRCAPKFKFRPKPTKLVERHKFRNPCAHHSTFNLSNLNPPPEEPSQAHDFVPPTNEPPKVITGTLTDEPQTYERNLQSNKPPHWMYMLSKPGSKDTPLVPHVNPYPREPDWSGETDGLKFYDGQDEGIHPKPPPDPCKRVANQPDEVPRPATPTQELEPVQEPLFQENFVLMPEKYNIRNMRPPGEIAPGVHDFQEASFQEFIDAKTSNLKKCSKSYPKMKENILYDLIRNSPQPPIDVTKRQLPPRKPMSSVSSQMASRSYSTLTSFHLSKPSLTNILVRMKADDVGRPKCKARRLVPKPRPCGPPVIGPTCNETELPCCPKARVPPKCDNKKVFPPCKKKLAPKPSYSECAKDPPPCPRITECNAWAKRDLENSKKASNPSKSRGFSNWAPEQVPLEKDLPKNELEGGIPEVRPPPASTQNLEASMAPGPSYSEYLDLIDNGQSFVNKNKWSSPPSSPSTKYAHKQRKVFSGKELMLNFVNPTEDTNSYYKSESLVRRRKPHWRSVKNSQVQVNNSDDQSVGSQLHEQKVISALLQDHHTRNDIRVKNLNFNEREAALSLYNSMEENSPKALMGSIGSWINNLLKAQRKRSHSCPQNPTKANQLTATTYVDTVDVDRMLKLTNPFRHRLKSHSSDNFASFYSADSPAGNQEHKKSPSTFKRLWGRHRSRSLSVFPKLKRERARSSMWKYESLSPTLDFTTRNVKLNMGRGQYHSGVARDREGAVRSGEHKHESVLWKTEKNRKDEEAPSRLTARRFDDFVITTPGKLGGRALLLDVNEVVSKEQGLCRRPSKTGTRRYIDNESLGMLPFEEDAKKFNMAGMTASKRSLTRFSLGSRDSSTLASGRSRAENRRWPNMSRTETSLSSEDLVQNLIKKVKVGRLPPARRHDVVINAETSKVKFRQSPTNSLVTSAIAKKEFDSQSGGKGSPRTSADGKLTKYAESEKAVMPFALPHKSWIYIDRGCDNSLRYDVKKHIINATVIKSKPKKWFNDDEYANDTKDYLCEGKKGKKKSNNDNVLKDDLKYCADKYLKRQEVRNMLSKLELKKNVLKIAENTVKMRQKEQNKKDMVNMLESHGKSSSEKAGGRFGWQHALFRNNSRPSQNRSVIEFAPEPVAQTPLNDVKSLIDIRETPTETKALNPGFSDIEMPKKLTNNVELYDSELDIDDCLTFDDKTSNLRVENIRKLSRPRDATEKLKFMKGLKDFKPKERDNLIGSYTYEKVTTLSLEKKEPKPIVPATITRPDVKASNSLQAVYHTRRFATETDSPEKPETGGKIPHKAQAELRPEKRRRRPPRVSHPPPPVDAMPTPNEEPEMSASPQSSSPQSQPPPESTSEATTPAASSPSPDVVAAPPPEDKPQFSLPPQSPPPPEENNKRRKKKKKDEESGCRWDYVKKPGPNCPEGR